MSSLYRAAQRAHLITCEKGDRRRRLEDGKVVDIDPDPDMHEPLLRSEGQRVSPRLPPGFRRHPPTDP